MNELDDMDRLDSLYRKDTSGAWIVDGNPVAGTTIETDNDVFCNDGRYKWCLARRIFGNDGYVFTDIHRGPLNEVLAITEGVTSRLPADPYSLRAWK
jgi:hypothetical protein